MDTALSTELKTEFRNAATQSSIPGKTRALTKVAIRGKTPRLQFPNIKCFWNKCGLVQGSMKIACSAHWVLLIVLFPVAFATTK